jgi:hypothetical protein
MNRLGMKGQTLLAGLLALTLGLPVAFHALPVIVSQFMVDDSFYYLEIARNLATGNGFTFDGLHPTNGFQPLFQLMLVPIFWLPLDLVGAVRAEKLLEAVMFGLTAMLLFRLAVRLTGSRFAGWLALIALFVPGPMLHPLGKGLFNGMESGIDALMIMLTLHMSIHSGASKNTTGFFALYGLVLGLLFLARLDNAFLIAGLGVWHLTQLRQPGGAPAKGLLVSAAVSLLIATSYLSWNLMAFDGLMPISGEVKAWISAQRTAELLALGWIPWLKNTLWFFTQGKAVGILPLAGLLAAPSLLAANAMLAHRNMPILDPQWKPMLLVLWLSSGLKIAYYCLGEAYPSNTLIWYYVQEIIVLGLWLAAAGRMLLSALSKRAASEVARMAVAAAFVVSWIGVISSRPFLEWELASLRMVPEIERIAGPEAIIGSWDAGVLGYFLPNPVVQLGGLVNDREFFRHLQDGRYREYLTLNGIQYLANLVRPGRDRHFLDDFGKSEFTLMFRSPEGIDGHPDWRYEVYRVPE